MTTHSITSLPDSRMNRLQRVLTCAAVLISLGIVASVGALYGSRLHGADQSGYSIADNKGKLKNFKTLRFTLYDVGILPRQARTTAGDIAISVIDQSGQSTGVIVARENDNQPIGVGQVKRVEHQQRAREVMNLQPGTYRVSMIDRPENTASLIVEP